MTYKDNGRYLVTRNGAQFACTYREQFKNVFISDIDGSAYVEHLLDTITELTGLRAAKRGAVAINQSNAEYIILAIDYSHSCFLLNIPGRKERCWTWFTFECAEAEGWHLKPTTPEPTVTMEVPVSMEGKVKEVLGL